MENINDRLIFKNCDIEIYENDIERALAEACDRERIDDLLEVGQRQWKAVMRTVGKILFPDTKVLRDKQYILLEGNNIPTNNNRFDYDIINKLCDYYMYISDRYNKLISAEAFSLFINTPRDTIGSWKDNDNKLSNMSFHIYKKIKDNRLDCIKDNSYDNGNVTGTMFVGNAEYGLNLPGVSKETSRKQVLTAADLPQLGSKNVQIAQNPSDDTE